MTQSVSILAKKFIYGFSNKIDLTSMDSIEVFDSQKRDLSDDSFNGVYGWTNLDTDTPIGYSIEWKKDSHSVTEVMTEIADQLKDDYNREIKPLKDGIQLILTRIK